MRYSVVYSLGKYDYEIEGGIPTMSLAQAIADSLQPYHDKPLEIKEHHEVRGVLLKVTDGLLYDMEMAPSRG
ncbi:MAG: hypothetical protein BWY45_02263 [Euryarchaeota archaeon ADurb.Bin294]|nr:MAG: hypothetical protein BWY45_02263 [Euryarchaeota archaeon ADurb.Bin294]